MKFFRNRVSAIGKDRLWSTRAELVWSFFTKKVEDIRSLTAGSTPPRVLPRTLSKLEGFEEITSEEATIMLRSLPAKTSELDKVPHLAHQRLRYCFRTDPGQISECITVDRNPFQKLINSLSFARDSRSPI